MGYARMILVTVLLAVMAFQAATFEPSGSSAGASRFTAASLSDV